MTVIRDANQITASAGKLESNNCPVNNFAAGCGK